MFANTKSMDRRMLPITKSKMTIYSRMIPEYGTRKRKTLIN